MVIAFQLGSTTNNPLLPLCTFLKLFPLYCSFVVDVHDYEGLDLEIEQDMEAFIDEIEQHLLMQDFDPELPVHQEQVDEDK